MMQVQHDRIRMGTTVKVRDRNGDREFTLVDSANVDPENGMISLASPIGKALLGRETGDRVTVRLPHGELILEIVGKA
jgi:transcription elongation factor GreA